MAKLIIGLLEAKKGKIQILGKELNEESVYELRSHVGIVFQNPENQIIFNSIEDELSFALKGLSKQEVDKRINVDPVMLDKQPAGIDVVGIQKEQNELKCVVCEVKASGDSKIPCNSSEGLLKDINNALDNRKRVEKEIFQ